MPVENSEVKQSDLPKRKEWVKPNIVDVDRSADDVATAVGTTTDGFGGSSS